MPWAISTPCFSASGRSQLGRHGLARRGQPGEALGRREHELLVAQRSPAGRRSARRRPPRRAGTGTPRARRRARRARPPVHRAARGAPAAARCGSGSRSSRRRPRRTPRSGPALPRGCRGPSPSARQYVIASGSWRGEATFCGRRRPTSARPPSSAATSTSSPRRAGATSATTTSCFDWSVTDLEGFWGSIWDFFEVRSHSALRARARRGGDARRRVVRRRDAELRRAHGRRATRTSTRSPCWRSRRRASPSS